MIPNHSVRPRSARRGARPALSLLLTALPVLAAGALLPSCSKGSGGLTAGGAKASLEIISCSLGCAGSPSGISCGPLNIHVNEEIAIEFNDAIDIDTVDKNTFQVVEIGSGAVPAASFLIDPGNPRRLIYRPALTFDSQGNPIFGLNANSTYRLTIPGSTTDKGPSQSFIRSETGRTNARRLECTLSATEGVNDLRIGRPSVDVFFDIARKNGGVDSEVLANPDADTVLENVFSETKIKLVFDDIMNPATVVNPVTNAATLIEVTIDPDGNPEDASDQVTVTGAYNISIDQENITTTVTFEPDQGLPSGKSLTETRMVVVNLPPGIVDLGGNSLQNSGFVAGIPEVITFDETILPGGTGENFATTLNRDRARTGANWGPTIPGGLQGALFPGSGGGGGRLGDLIVFAGEEPTVFDTDGTVFDGVNLVTTFDGVTGEPDPITVDDGIFEFATVQIAPGAVVRFEGSQPARLFARGEMVVQGVVDVSGESLGLFPSLPCDAAITDASDPFYCDHLDPDLADCGAAANCPDGVAHGDGDGDLTEAEQKDYLDSKGLLPEFFQGQRGGAGGAGGGAGGKGGDLPPFDATQVPSLADVFGLDNLNDVIDVNGSNGVGVPFPNILNPTGTTGGGGGSTAFPLVFPAHANDTAALTISPFGFVCNEPISSSSGAGGANASDGGPPINRKLGDNAVNTTAPMPPGGDNALLAFDPTLDPLAGFLRGGGGGGGAGASIADTQANGVLLACFNNANPPLIADYRQSRGGGGGGGGGGIQIQSGKRLVVDGVIDASGGSGGGVGVDPPLSDRMDHPPAGGSGAGGVILVQSEQVEIAALPARLRVDGGERALGLYEGATGKVLTRGGHGGSGWVRVESGLTANQSLKESAVETRVSPTQDDLDLTVGGSPDYVDSPPLSDLVSVDIWRPLGIGDVPAGLPAQPELRTGGQSCWMKPDGNVFFTRLLEDTNQELGWDMDVFIVGLDLVRSWREDDDLLEAIGFDPPTWEATLGNQVGTAPVVVRFQGARAIGPVKDMCDVDLSGDESPILPGSLTPWVKHPAELNDINGKESLRPNLIRFQVIFDNNAFGAGLVGGITFLQIGAQGE